MKKLVLVFVFVMISGVSYAQVPGGTGLGVIIGNPTGVSFKKWIDSSKAVDAAAAWSFANDGVLQVHLDLLFHDFTLLDRQWPVYYGIGGAVGIADDLVLGVRFPLGISYLFPSDPFDIFFEIVPRLNLMPETDFGIDGAIGFRFYFR